MRGFVTQLLDASSCSAVKNTKKREIFHDLKKHINRIRRPFIEKLVVCSIATNKLPLAFKDLYVLVRY